jgi:hypothetical protein
VSAAKGSATVHVLPGSCSCGAKFWFDCRCREIIAYTCDGFYVWCYDGVTDELECGGTPDPRQLAWIMAQHAEPGTDYAYIHGNSDYPAQLAKERAALAAGTLTLTPRASEAA